jgi:hypothetical protein
LAAWLDKYLNDAWDEQMQADAESGRLDRTFAKDLTEIKADEIATQRSWLELEGIATDSGNDEDAQDWVNQMREVGRSQKSVADIRMKIGAALFGSTCDGFLTNDFQLKKVAELRILVVEELEV